MMKYKDKNGYLRISVDGRLVGEHRIVAEQLVGRPLTADEVAHHKNEIKSDNDPANLEVKTKSEHARDHALERALPRVTLRCPGCEGTFEQKPGRHHARKKNGSLEYCSRSCAGKAARAKQVARTEFPHGESWKAYKDCPPPRCDACRAFMRKWAQARPN